MTTNQGWVCLLDAYSFNTKNLEHFFTKLCVLCHISVIFYIQCDISSLLVLKLEQTMQDYYQNEIRLSKYWSININSQSSKYVNCVHGHIT